MAFIVTTRRIDIDTGGDARVVLLRGHDATAFGINPGDRLLIRSGKKSLIVVADVTHHSIQHGEIGLFEEVWKLLKIRDGQPLTIELISRPESIAAIRKKMHGQELDDKQIFAIMSDIVNHRLSPVEMTYFVASGYVKPYTDRELIAMVRAMAETGEMFRWSSRRVVDKHSVGGLAGNRTTMVAIPIVAALGVTIPKTSSRAITSPAGTADTMEVLAPVSFGNADVRRIVKRTHGCLIWGGGLSIAPADDIIIRLSRPLSLEPYDKMIVSIMAKKVAMGVKYLIIDMPYGPGTKIPNMKTARELERKFILVGRAFNMVVKVKLDQAREPVGQGIGPSLEARDVLRVLQQKPNRPMDLERKALGLAAELLELSKAVRPGTGLTIATDVLRSGKAWKKMQQIISAQGGDPLVDANDLTKRAKTLRVAAPKSGTVKAIDNRAIDEISRTLGAPDHKLGGIFLHHKLGQRVKKGEKLFTLYSYSPDRLRLGIAAVQRHLPVRLG